MSETMPRTITNDVRWQAVRCPILYPGWVPRTVHFRNQRPTNLYLESANKSFSKNLMTEELANSRYLQIRTVLVFKTY